MSEDQDGFIAGVRREIAQARGPDAAAAYEQAAPPEQLYAGLERYWRKRAEARLRLIGAPVSWEQMSQTVELPRVGGPGSGLGGLWRVVVLNDEHNTFDHVAETLSRVIPGREPRRRATGSPTGSTRPGCAIVWSGPREDAETYWEQLDGAGLTMAPLEERVVRRRDTPRGFGAAPGAPWPPGARG